MMETGRNEAQGRWVQTVLDEETAVQRAAMLTRVSGSRYYVLDADGYEVF
jgi:hypothetical protein